MLPEPRTSGQLETVYIPKEQPEKRAEILPQAARRLLPFLAVVVQFGLLVLLVDQWHIKGLALARVMQLAFFGFIIHHFLPARHRLPFFGLLSLLATVMVVGEVGAKTLLAGVTGVISPGSFLYQLLPGAVIIGIGLLLIALCHLPIRWGGRVMLLTGAGAGLALFRANTEWMPDIGGVWVILGSMFVFRLMVYMYDLKTRSAPFSPARAVAYFFMLPNVCFPLFPLVDYKTFCSTYYNEEWTRIYQTGLQWMLRGVLQLLLYQAIYQYAPLDVASLGSALGVAGFVLSTYLLYLHVSGQFHLIVGLLHMFGFNLPETHHLFLLASSFTDFWRRINIYWKDFIMKLFFYPVFFRLRKMGTLRAMAVSTLVTFFLTWLLHSWQWFWIRGSFLHTWQDISFWAILALLVMVNALYEATKGSKRKLTTSRVTIRERAIMGAKTIGTFSVICLLWTVWSCQSAEELQTLVDAASDPRIHEILICLAALGLIGLAGAIWGRSSRETSQGRSLHPSISFFPFWRIAGTVGASAAVLCAIPFVSKIVFPKASHVVARLRQDALNAGDMRTQRRGYYEELDAARSNTGRERRVEEPKGWFEGRKVFYRERSDFQMVEIAPSIATVLGGVTANTNALGLRDREYPFIKSPGTHRTVLLGASHDQGTGVGDSETYENIVEDRLNSLHHPARRERRFEILNLSVGGHSILQRLYHFERRGLEFLPDLVLFSVAATDRQFTVQHVRKWLVQGIEASPEYREFLTSITQKSGVNGQMPELMIERRLLPHVAEIHGWAFRRLARECGRRGIQGLVLYRPAPADFEGTEVTASQEIRRLVEGANLRLIDLSPAFLTEIDRSALILAPWDHHTTPRGHWLLAETLYQELVPLLPPTFIHQR